MRRSVGLVIGVWALLSVVVALAVGLVVYDWAGFRALEGALLVFAYGMGWHAFTPKILRAIWRWASPVKSGWR